MSPPAPCLQGRFGACAEPALSEPCLACVGPMWGRRLAPRLRRDGLRGPVPARHPSRSPGPAVTQRTQPGCGVAVAQQSVLSARTTLPAPAGSCCCCCRAGMPASEGESLHILFLQHFELKPCCSGESLAKRRWSPVSLLHQPFLSRRESAVQLSDSLPPSSAWGSAGESCRLGHCGASSWFR